MKTLCLYLLLVGIPVYGMYVCDQWHLPPPEDTPDLSVMFIERLPRYKGVVYEYTRINDDPVYGTGDLLPPQTTEDHKQWPHYGDTVTFIAHVKNVGTGDALPFDWYWTINGREVDSGVTSHGLAPGEIRTFTNTWQWKDGDNYVAFDVNRRRLGEEITWKNNAVVDQINALAFHFFVEESVVDWFSTVRNGKDSYGWADWAQMQVQEMNRTFRDDIHPATPEGITLRVRLDRIFVVPDGWGNPGGMHTPGVVVPVDVNYPELRPWWDTTNDTLSVEVYGNNNTGSDGVWGFTVDLLSPSPAHGGSNFYERSNHWLTGPEWPLFHELGHQLGLHDYYLTPVYPEHNHAAPGVGFMGRTAFRDQMMHHGNYSHDRNIGLGQGRWDAQYRFWEEGAALALSRYRHRRRGMFGWFIDSAPEENRVIFLREDGTPVAYADVAFYRPRGRGYTNPEIPDTPAFFGVTDADGAWLLPEPPFSKAFNWGSNGTFFFLLQDGDNARTGWLTYDDLNREYYRGKTVGEYFIITAPYTPEEDEE